MQSAFRILTPVAVLVVGVGVVRWRSEASQVNPDQTPVLAALYAPPVERVETHVLNRGETLSDVLGRASITGHDLAEFLLGARSYIDPRRMADGVEVTVRRWVSDSTPRSIDLRVNADTTVRLRRDAGGWGGALAVTPVVLDTVYTQGRIAPGESLFQDVVYSKDDSLPIGDRTQLVYNLADIYEFKFDFTRDIQAGDTYRLVYEREVRPDGSARAQRILASEIVSQGQKYTAVWFAGGKEAQGFYDLEGRPLANGFSRYPVDFRITSSFSPRRYHPVLGIYRAHLGTDFGAPAGTPVHVTADGVVTFAGWNGGYGNLVIVRHTNGYETRYAHMRAFGRGIRTGMSVKQKQVIGYVGQTGLATGAHLHYELRRNGVAVNAVRAKVPLAQPIRKELRAAFDSAASTRMAILDQQTQRYLAHLAAHGAKTADDN